MDEALTGGDAVEAISLAVQIGNRDVRFDGRRVFRDLRTRAGRIRVGVALTLARFHVIERPRPRGAARRRTVRALRLAAATEAPSRPSGTPEREDGPHGS